MLDSLWEQKCDVELRKPYYMCLDNCLQYLLCDLRVASFTTHFCFLLNTVEGMKRKKTSAFGMGKYLVSLESLGNPVLIQSKTHHKVEKIPITLYLLSLTFSFFLSPNLEMENQHCAGKCLFSRSLLSYKQGPNV